MVDGCIFEAKREGNAILALLAIAVVAVAAMACLRLGKPSITPPRAVAEQFQTLKYQIYPFQVFESDPRCLVSEQLVFQQNSPRCL